MENFLLKNKLINALGIVLTILIYVLIVTNTSFLEGRHTLYSRVTTELLLLFYIGIFVNYLGISLIRYFHYIHSYKIQYTKTKLLAGYFNKTLFGGIVLYFVASFLVAVGWPIFSVFSAIYGIKSFFKFLKNRS